jgi:hypothetical protein
MPIASLPFFVKAPASGSRRILFFASASLLRASRMAVVSALSFSRRWRSS